MTLERWAQFTLAFQLVNIGSELQRAKSLLEKKDSTNATHSLVRALDLLDKTIILRPYPGKKDMTRLRSCITNLINTTPELEVSLADICHELEPFEMRVAQERGLMSQTELKDMRKDWNKREQAP